MAGLIRDHTLFFLYGTGSNGKSTFLRTIIAMLGDDYAMQAAPDVLTVSKDGTLRSWPTWRAHGLVASIEVDEGKRLAEALVSGLTGGDPMKARFMRQDFFQFEPTFKLFLAANHKPVIRGTDWAIWRRVKLIPFLVTIPRPSKIRCCREAKGGAARHPRMGCARLLAWQRDSMAVPEQVKQATDAYRAESDTLAAFPGRVHHDRG